jgi:hypothetical protein
MPTANITCKSSATSLYDRDGTYSTARNNSTAQASLNPLYVGNDKAADYGVFRTFLFFDTSSIPLNAVITSSNLSIAYVDTRDTSIDDYVQLVAHTAADGPSLGDYDQISGTDMFTSAPQYTSFSKDTYKSIGLNSTGISQITKGGLTKFALRAKGDTDNSTPGARSFIIFGDTSGSYPPVLQINYIFPSNSLFFSQI